jgi:malate/lactate dehydrogenase
MHIGYIGASGKVGRVAIQNFYANNEVEDIRLTLYSPRPDKDRGLLLDIKGHLPMMPSHHQGKFVAMSANATDRFEDMKSADLIVISAGLWPSKEQREIFEKFDSTGRMVQTYANHDLIASFSKKISVVAPDALVLIVTNQTDMMSEVARQFLRAENVLGYGGILDSARFRMLLSKEKNGNDNAAFVQGYKSERGHVVGYHNNEMIALTSSLTTKVSSEEVEHAVEETRKQGGGIAMMQRDPRSESMATGASIAPGYGVYRTMAALTGQLPTEEAFNVVVTDKMVARKYGVPQEASLSVPISLKRGAYEVVSHFPVSKKEQDHLHAAHKRFVLDVEKVAADMKKPTRGTVLKAAHPKKALELS